MNILVLGGTRFVGRAFVAAASRQGHAVTIFNRGQSAAAPAQCEWIAGDRTRDLRALDGRQFDVVLDTWGGDAAVVAAAAGALKDRVGHYVYVSTISVYANLWCPGQHEDSPVIAAADPAPASAPERYRVDKVRSEAALRDALADRLLILRPGIIVGPHDDTDRLTAWLRRCESGAPVTAPMAPNQPLQLIDVRDFCAFALQLAERREVGIFNAVGPDLTFGAFLEQCRSAAGSRCEFAWETEVALLARGLYDWDAFPFWIPHCDWAQRGFFCIDNRKAVQGGLTFLPLAETMRDVFQGLREGR